MTPKSIEQIMEESADSCMAVLQGFILGRYGEAVVAREISDEFRLILKEYTQSLLLEAERQIKPEITRDETGNSNLMQQTLIMQGYKMATSDYKQVLRNMRGENPSV